MNRLPHLTVGSSVQQSWFTSPLRSLLARCQSKSPGGRNLRAIISGLGAAAARASQVGVTLFTLPMTMAYLGRERFGLWVTIQSVMTMAAFSDFGLGNGILNSVAAAYGQDDNSAVRRIASSGLTALFAIASVLFAIFFCAYGFVSWANVFNVSSPLARSEAGPVLFVFATCFAINIPLAAIQRVQLGLQEAYLASAWQLGGSALALVGVVAGLHSKTSFVFLVAVVAGSPVLANGLNTLYFFWIRRPDLRFSFHFVSRDEIVRIARIGGLFFILQLVVAIAYCADNLVIARTLGAVNVPEYSIPQRMFQIVSLAISMLLSPLWPAYGEALSRGDTDWIQSTLVRTLRTVFAFTALISGLLLLLCNKLLYWWVGPNVHPPFALLLGLAVWTIIDCCGNTIAMFLNGASILRFQILFACLFGVACLATKFFLTGLYGIAAIPWSTCLTYLIFSVIPCVIYIPKILKRMKIANELICIPS